MREAAERRDCMKRKSSFFPGVGASSILMIFVVLCLTMFGVLSFVTANADYKISTKNANTVENYYKASSSAQQKLAEIDSVLLQAKSDAARYSAKPFLLYTMNDSVYFENQERFTEITDYLRSGASSEQKLDYAYRVFSALRLARIDGVTVTQSEDGQVQASLALPVDTNRTLALTAAVEPYSASQRYRVTQQKLIGTEQQDNGDSSSLSLWSGSSAQ